MSFVKSVKGIAFNADREGFLFALSRRESSSNLKLSDSVAPNISAQNVHNNVNNNNYGYIGYFQFGESALYDAGYFTVPYAFSSSNSSDFQKALRKQDWVGSWTGKDGVTSKAIFLSGRRHQWNAINIMLNKHCRNLRNLNINEFYGKVVQGVEITESGCVAGCHLKGASHVLDFVRGAGNAADAFGTKVGEYISLLAHYDLQSCCNRRIHLLVVQNGVAVEGIQVDVESEYREGIYFNEVGVIKNSYTTDAEGRIPVLIRHPGAKIKISVGGKSVEITQEANKIQNYKIDVTQGFSARSVLAAPSTPEPKPVENKTPQELRNETEQKNTENIKQNSTAKKDVNFNLEMVEGDTNRPISNIRFYLTYKGNIKEHQTDNNGMKSNIIATVGQDIEVSVAKAGGYQVIHHFIVQENMQRQTVKVKLPVHKFKIKVVGQTKNIIANTSFIIFYRGRQIQKKTDQNGIFNLTMLTGFVYGFGLLNAKELVKCRCDKNIFEQEIILNQTAVKQAEQFEQLSVAQPIVLSPVEVPKTKATTNTSEANAKPQKPAITQYSTHTQTQGNPVTVISNGQGASDTTRYHIYHNGEIRRENAQATSYAEFIYYDENGTVHNLGKSAYIVAPRRASGNVVIKGNVYLIDQRQHSSYRSGEIGFKLTIISENCRYYLNGITMAAVLGTLMSLPYEEYIGSGWSDGTGRSVGGSTSHINGQAGDFRFLGINKEHRTRSVHTPEACFDMQANTRLVEKFREFGFRTFYTQDRAGSSTPKIPNTRAINPHHHHLHIGNHDCNVKDI